MASAGEPRRLQPVPPGLLSQPAALVLVCVVSDLSVDPLDSTAEEERHRSASNLGLPPEAAHAASGTGGSPAYHSPRVRADDGNMEIYSPVRRAVTVMSAVNAFSAMGGRGGGSGSPEEAAASESSEEDEPLFLDRYSVNKAVSDSTVSQTGERLHRHGMDAKARRSAKTERHAAQGLRADWDRQNGSRFFGSPPRFQLPEEGGTAEDGAPPQRRPKAKKTARPKRDVGAASPDATDAFLRLSKSAAASLGKSIFLHVLLVC